MKSSTTFSECKEACESIATCTAIYTDGGQNCYIHFMSRTDLDAAGAVAIAAGFDTINSRYTGCDNSCGKPEDIRGQHGYPVSGRESSIRSELNYCHKKLGRSDSADKF